MSVTKDAKTGKWISQVRVEDWQGNVVHKKKRGFQTKKEGLEWENQIRLQYTADVGMLFGDFIALYFEDMSHRLKETTLSGKRFMVDKKITPVFSKMPMSQISPTDIRKWQNGKDIISTPKTPKSNRVVTIPKLLVECLQTYFSMLYELKKNDRIFPVSKSYMAREITKGCKECGVKRIRVHDTRHSHASLLIEMGFSPLLIADRLGHEKVETTLNTYSHLYPSKQAEVAERLDNL